MRGGHNKLAIGQHVFLILTSPFQGRMADPFRKERIPTNMRRLIFTAAFTFMYSFVAQVSLTDRDEIVVSLLGGAASLLALGPGLYRTKFMMGLGVSFFPQFFSFNRFLRALCIGVCVGYLQTCCEMYACSLCIRTKKKEAFVLCRLCMSLIATFTLFLNHFFPYVKTAIHSPVCALLFPAAALFVAFQYIIKTPYEILEEQKASGVRKDDVFEAVYRVLAYINSPVESDEDFHQDYKALIEKAYETREVVAATSAETQVRAALNKLGLSFVYLGLQFVLCCKLNTGLYCIFMGMMQLFSWATAYAFEAPPFMSAFFLVGSLYMISVCTNLSEIFMIPLLFAGYAAIPSEASIYALSERNLAVVDASRSLLAAGVFYTVMHFWPD